MFVLSVVRSSGSRAVGHHCHNPPVSELPTMRRPILAIFAAVASVSFAQDYGDNYADYADNQDNLYANYAAKQEAKAV